MFRVGGPLCTLWGLRGLRMITLGRGALVKGMGSAWQAGGMHSAAGAVSEYHQLVRTRLVGSE